MHEGHPHRRRQARAIAISESIEARRAVMKATIALAMAAVAVLVMQALSASHGLMAFSHP